MWDRTGLPDDQRPEVERIRFVDLREWGPTLASCMNDAGWDGVVAKPDGGIHQDGYTEDLRGAYAYDWYICTAKYPTDPVVNSPLNELQMKYLYRYRAGEMRQCLIDLGNEISEPTSEQVFLDEYPRTGGYNPINEVNDSHWTEAEEKCPQLPKGLWG